MSIEVTDQLRNRFYAAQRVWPIRNQKAPNKEDDAAITWAQWFEKKHSQSLVAFAAYAKANNLREVIREYELVRFGRSPLEKVAA